MVASVQSRLAEYNAQWAARGPALLAATRDLVGQPFNVRDARAAIVTCGLPSLGTPLLLDARGFWRASPDSAADEHTRFVYILFHELLLPYFGAIQYAAGSTTPRPTPLLAKYAAEPAQVQEALHHWALEQLAYERLGLAHEWVLAKALHRTIYNPGRVIRAEEIIAAEGAEAFVHELRALALQPPRTPR
jgi:hypothetical protein